MIKLHQLPLGPADNLIYLLQDEATQATAVIDPAWDVPAIMEQAAVRGCVIDRILLTHTHHDHVNGVDQLLDHCDVPVFVNPREVPVWPGTPETWHPLAEGDVLHLGETELRVLETPGHSPGGVCFQFDSRMIVGDTIFVYGCGHCRAPGADPAQLFASLQRLKQEVLPETTLYPGHDYGATSVTTMAEQRAGNPWLQLSDEAAFIRHRRHGCGRSTPYGPYTFT